uniref:Uncharacterized protein n=1 Tax=Anguilla anguilla TaxID=7936 RepID=A0A0E9T4R0_ANGAN
MTSDRLSFNTDKQDTCAFSVILI